MIARDWRRLRRLQGWRPYGLIAVALLLTAVLTDDLYVEYDRVATRLQSVESALTVARDKAERLPQLSKQRQEVGASYAGVSGRLVPATEASASAGGEKFGQLLRSWYEAKGVTQLAVKNLDRREAHGIVLYRAEIEAAMRVEQFVGLLQGRAYAPAALRLEHAAVDANDAVAPTGLRTVMTWEGAQAPALPPVEKAAKSDKKPEKGSPKPPEKVREPRGDSSAVKILEEKRK